MSAFVADGHRLSIMINNDELGIQQTLCPHDGGSKGLCNAGKSGCVVRKFVSVYGMDFCVGSAAVDGLVEIAWLAVVGDSELDDDIGAVYFTPVKDKDFMASVSDEGFDALAGL